MNAPASPANTPVPPSNAPAPLSRQRLARLRRAKRQREQAAYWIQIITFVFGLLGGGFGLLQYFETQRKEREAMVQAIYDRVDEKYSEFIKACIQNPLLDCYSTPTRQPIAPGDQLRQKLLYTQLANVFEVAFLRYTNSSFRAISNRSAQWGGWVIYMDRFAVRPTFRTVWAEVKDEFDPSFVDCMSAVTRVAETRQDYVTAQSLEAMGTQVKGACRL